MIHQKLSIETHPWQTVGGGGSRHLVHIAGTLLERCHEAGSDLTPHDLVLSKSTSLMGAPAVKGTADSTGPLREGLSLVAPERDSLLATGLSPSRSGLLCLVSG